MTPTRRAFLAGSASLLAAPYIARGAFAREAGAALPVPALIEVGDGPETIEAIKGQSAMLSGAKTPTLGFSQPYLGPVLRVKRGANARMKVVNRMSEPVTAHWHGLHVPAVLDGGPKLEIAPGQSWDPELPIDQPASTAWYHSHVHYKTATQVYQGLAGMIIIDDPSAPDPGLPKTYGLDDIPLVIQDRVFGSDGGLVYSGHHHNVRHGFRGDTVLVNGAIQPRASVPAGLVRLRLLNGSNARIYHLRFADDRTFHQVASDGGLLARPRTMTKLTLAPAERAEIIVDFGAGAPVALLSGPDRNAMMGGMGRGHMGGRMGGMGGSSPRQADGGRQGEFEVMRFAPDKAKPGLVKKLPASFPGAPKVDFGEPVRRRRISLDMHGMGGGMGGHHGGGMGRGMGGGRGRGGHMGGMMGGLAINGEAFDIDRVDLQLKRGETELWEINADMMAHPFHVHATSFQVVSQNGAKTDFAQMGLKDVVLVEGRAEILLRIDHPASDAVPFLYHCHILEHEDGGMMGQFTVS